MYGLAVYGLYRSSLGSTSASSTGIAADRGWQVLRSPRPGLYELTPLKSVCLSHCPSPIHYVLGGWREGRLGALRMGATVVEKASG